VNVRGAAGVKGSQPLNWIGKVWKHMHITKSQQAIKEQNSLSIF